MDAHSLDQLLHSYTKSTGQEADLSTLEHNVWRRIQRRERALTAPSSEWAFSFGRFQFAGAALTLLLGVILGTQMAGFYETKSDDPLAVFSGQSPYLIANFVSGSS